MERFNLKKLYEVGGKENYRVKISNRFAVWGNLEADMNINRARETTENFLTPLTGSWLCASRRLVPRLLRGAYEFC
jgi:hypothetical protein